MSLDRDILVKGVVFSDLGRAGAFLGIDWVRNAVRERVGFDPYPGTLNLRVHGDDLDRWGQVRQHGSRVMLLPPDPAFCNAFLLTGFVQGWAPATGFRRRVAVVVPAVENYPADKLEIVAAVSLKQAHSVRDGDALMVVFGGPPSPGRAPGAGGTRRTPYGKQGGYRR